jgi:alpha-beta hydrolase superfamily lysophospholipase
MTPVDYGLNYQEISFTTSDGLTLQGWYIPSANGAAVILTHHMASNRVGVLETAYMLARNGYGVLLFDLRAHGESQGEVLPFGGAEAEDIVAAAAYLQSREDIDPDGQEYGLYRTQQLDQPVIQRAASAQDSGFFGIVSTLKDRTFTI